MIKEIEYKTVLIALAVMMLSAPVYAQKAIVDQASEKKPPAYEESESKKSQPPITGFDSRGNPTSFDPSENVKALSAAADKRQDDLRLAAKELFEAKEIAADNLNRLRYMQTQELASSLAAKLSDEAKLRAEFADRLASAEAKRIDAIRAVDVGAAANLATRTTEQATALATGVNQSAEVLRNQVSKAAEDTRALVATTAATALQNQQQQFATMVSSISSIAVRVAALEQGSAEGIGKQKYQDPALAALLARVETIVANQNSNTGIGTGHSEVIGWIVAGLMLLIGMATFAMRAFGVRRTARA
jgi:hypothetical protein